MDIPQSFTYVFDDERWVSKLLIGAAISIVSIFILPAFLLSGYSVAITRNVLAGSKSPLPEWDDWGQLFKDGLSLFLIQLIYGAPIWLLLGCGAIATVTLSGGLSGGNDDALAGGLFGIWGIISCVSILLGLLLAFITPVATVRYAQTGEIGPALQVREVVADVRDNLGQIVLLIVALIGVATLITLVVGFVGIIPCIGWIASIAGSVVIAPYLTVVAGHLYGQLGLAMGGSVDKVTLDL